MPPQNISWEDYLSYLKDEEAWLFDITSDPQKLHAYGTKNFADKFVIGKPPSIPAVTGGTPTHNQHTTKAGLKSSVHNVQNQQYSTPIYGKSFGAVGEPEWKKWVPNWIRYGWNYSGSGALSDWTGIVQGDDFDLTAYEHSASSMELIAGHVLGFFMPTDYIAMAGAAAATNSVIGAGAGVGTAAVLGGQKLNQLQKIIRSLGNITTKGQKLYAKEKLAQTFIKGGIKQDKALKFADDYISKNWNTEHFLKQGFKFNNTKGLANIADDVVDISTKPSLWWKAKSGIIPGATGFGAYSFQHSLADELRKNKIDPDNPDAMADWDAINWERVAKETGEGMFLGGLLAGTGGPLELAAMRKGAWKGNPMWKNLALSKAGRLGIEVGTLVGVPSLMHGEKPTKEQFIMATGTVLGIKGVNKVAGKMFSIAEKRRRQLKEEKESLDKFKKVWEEVEKDLPTEVKNEKILELDKAHNELNTIRNEEAFNFLTSQAKLGKEFLDRGKTKDSKDITIKEAQSIIKFLEEFRHSEEYKNPTTTESKEYKKLHDSVYDEFIKLAGHPQPFVDYNMSESDSNVKIKAMPKEFLSDYYSRNILKETKQGVGFGKKPEPVTETPLKLNDLLNKDIISKKDFIEIIKEQYPLEWKNSEYSKGTLKWIDDAGGNARKDILKDVVWGDSFRGNPGGTVGYETIDGAKDSKPINGKYPKGLKEDLGNEITGHRTTKEYREWLDKPESEILHPKTNGQQGKGAKEGLTLSELADAKYSESISNPTNSDIVPGTNKGHKFEESMNVIRHWAQQKLNLVEKPANLTTKKAYVKHLVALAEFSARLGKNIIEINNTDLTLFLRSKYLDANSNTIKQSGDPAINAIKNWNKSYGEYKDNKFDTNVTLKTYQAGRGEQVTFAPDQIFRAMENLDMIFVNEKNYNLSSLAGFDVKQDIYFSRKWNAETEQYEPKENITRTSPGISIKNLKAMMWFMLDTSARVGETINLKAPEDVKSHLGERPGLRWGEISFSNATVKYLQSKLLSNRKTSEKEIPIHGETRDLIIEVLRETRLKETGEGRTTFEYISTEILGKNAEYLDKLWTSGKKETVHEILDRHLKDTEIINNPVFETIKGNSEGALNTIFNNALKSQFGRKMTPRHMRQQLINWAKNLDLSKYPELEYIVKETEKGGLFDKVGLGHTDSGAIDYYTKSVAPSEIVKYREILDIFHSHIKESAGKNSMNPNSNQGNSGINMNQPNLNNPPKNTNQSGPSATNKVVISATSNNQTVKNIQTVGFATGTKQGNQTAQNTIIYQGIDSENFSLGNVTIEHIKAMDKGFNNKLVLSKKYNNKLFRQRQLVNQLFVEYGLTPNQQRTIKEKAGLFYKGKPSLKGGDLTQLTKLEHMLKGSFEPTSKARLITQELLTSELTDKQLAEFDNIIKKNSYSVEEVIKMGNENLYQALKNHQYESTSVFGQIDVHLHNIRKLGFDWVKDKIPGTKGFRSLNKLYVRDEYLRQYAKDKDKAFLEDIQNGRGKASEINAEFQKMTDFVSDYILKTAKENMNPAEYAEFKSSWNNRYVQDYFMRHLTPEAIEYYFGTTKGLEKMTELHMEKIVNKQLKEVDTQINDLRTQRNNSTSPQDIKNIDKKLQKLEKERSEKADEIRTSPKFLNQAVLNAEGFWKKSGWMFINKNIDMERGVELPLYIEDVNFRGGKKIQVYETNLEKYIGEWARGTGKALATYKYFPELTQIRGEHTHKATKEDPRRIFNPTSTTARTESGQALPRYQEYVRQAFLQQLYGEKNVLYQTENQIVRNATSIVATQMLMSPMIGYKNANLGVLHNFTVGGMHYVGNLLGNVVNRSLGLHRARELGINESVSKHLEMVGATKLSQAFLPHMKMGEIFVRAGAIGMNQGIIAEHYNIVNRKPLHGIHRVKEPFLLSDKVRNKVINEGRRKLKTVNKLSESDIAFIEKYSLDPKRLEREHGSDPGYNKLKEKQLDIIDKSDFGVSQTLHGGTGVSNLPLWTKSSWAKPFMLFYKIAYGVTKNLNDNVVKPVGYGNVMPLARYMVGSYLSAEASWWLLNNVFGKEMPVLDKDYANWTNKVKAYISRIEFLGIASSFFSPYHGKDGTYLSQYTPAIISVSGGLMQLINEQYTRMSRGDSHLGTEQSLSDFFKKTNTLYNDWTKVRDNWNSSYRTTYNRARTLQSTYMRDHQGQIGKDTHSTHKLKETYPYYYDLEKAFMSNDFDKAGKLYWDAVMFNTSLYIQEHVSDATQSSKFKWAYKKAQKTLDQQIKSFRPVTFSNKSDEGIVDESHFRSLLSDEQKVLLTKAKSEYGYLFRNFQKYKSIWKRKYNMPH